jgi:uncharacterized protein YkwD
MFPRLPSVAAIASAICMALAPSAAAEGISSQGVAEHLPRAERSATASSLLIAPAAVCPDQSVLTAPVEAQEQAMLCMTDFARTSVGLGELADAEELDRSSLEKAEDVIRCDSFSHFACGREFTYWIREAGYIGDECWRAGENLAWGNGEYGSVRAIFRAWMSSPTHRRNILGDYSQVGIALTTGALEGHESARVWAAHFGSHCESATA